MKSFSILTALSLTSAALASWPNGPFKTSGRWLLDASGSNVTYAGVNWPAHVETMLPEGLQYQSIDSIVSQIKSLGMNAVRLTWAVQMVDEIYANGGQDVDIRTAFVNALGQENGTAVLQRVLKNNPSFSEGTTRLQVFDALATSLASSQIYIHLDNHVSKSGWCCTPFDGNSWPGDGYFPLSNWTRALGYMAAHGKAHWPNLMSMSLRNELRQPLDNISLYDQSYNWDSWYGFVREGAKAVNGNNSDVLVFLSGLDSDTNLANVTSGGELSPGSETFKLADFPGMEDKIVLELHNYDGGKMNCTELQAELYTDGFGALNGTSSSSASTRGSLQLPVMMTEWGFAQDNTTWQNGFATCLEAYLPAQHAGWFVWVIAGSYYVRTGQQDYDETWGLLNHNWSGWRSESHIEGGLKPMVKKTLAYLNGTGSGGNGTDGGGASGTSGSGGGAAATSTPAGASGQERPRASMVTTCLLAFGLAALFCIGMTI